jgi:microcystin-dependent protein
MSKLRKDFGSVTIWDQNGVNMQTNRIMSVGEPVEDLDGANKEYVDRVTQVGDLKMSARAADHFGWLVCDGRSVDRAVYPLLFAIIGTTYGSASSSTFNLPDCRGRVLGTIGQGAGLTNRVSGTAVGEETHTMSVNEMPSHTHSGTTDAGGAHSHTYNDAYFAEAGGNQINGNSVFGTSGDTDTDNQFRWRTANGSWSNTPQDINTSTAAAHTHTFTTGTTGSGQAFNVMQPTLFVGNTFIFGAH